MNARVRTAAALTGCLMVAGLLAAPATASPAKKVDLSKRLLTVAEAQSITGFTGTLVAGASSAKATSWSQAFDDQASGKQKFGVGIWVYPRAKAQTAAQLLATADSLMPGSIKEMQCQVVEKVPPKATKVCWSEDVIYAVSVRKFGTTGVFGSAVQLLGTVPDPANPSETFELTATDALREKVATDAQWLRDDQKAKALTGSV